MVQVLEIGIFVGVDLFGFSILIKLSQLALSNGFARGLMLGSSDALAVPKGMIVLSMWLTRTCSGRGSSQS
jgi:hypothetical protein